MGAKFLMGTFLAACCSLAASEALTAEGLQQVKEQATQEMKTTAKEQVYGSQIMTRQERMEYRAKMRAAKTQQEREQLRKEHHERMKVRAAEKGVTLPEEPPATGMRKGMGPGGGMGAGPRGR